MFLVGAGDLVEVRRRCFWASSVVGIFNDELVVMYIHRQLNGLIPVMDYTVVV